MSNSQQPTTNNPLARYWLLVGVAALAVAGLYALALVVARTPQLASLPVFARLFHEALVVHVDLSVLVWFLCIACLLWSRVAPQKPLLPWLEEAALICMGLGAALIALSPLDPKGEAMMSNYIPVIYSPVFFLGLSLVGCAVALMATKMSAMPAQAGIHASPLPVSPDVDPGLRRDDISMNFALRGAAFIALAALVAFVWSWRGMPAEIVGQQYYDMLFWGGGHMLQFTHVQVVMVCWLMLATALGLREVRGLKFLFSIGLIAAAGGLALYPAFDIASMQHRDYFTWLMIAANGIAPGILALWLLPGLWKRRQKNALWSSLMASLLLFLYGGALGGMITGQNVVIPAHYHGSIVGVTLGFMGLAYLLLPEFGYRDVTRWRLARWQPAVYGAGQVLHITGLAYSGGYGVLRKTPGGMADLPADVKAALGFMGLGGLIAIIGGLMFVIVVARAIRPIKNP